MDVVAGARAFFQDNGRDIDRHPGSYTAQRLPQHILAERLGMLAAEQQPDGGWPTPYNEKWRGWVTIQGLLVLKTFGRI